MRYSDDHYDDFGRKYVQAVRERVVIFDGATGTTLRARRAHRRRLRRSRSRRLQRVAERDPARRDRDVP